MADTESPRGYVDVCSDVRVIDVSPEARTLYGWDGTELVGRRLDELLLDERGGRIDWPMRLERARTGGVWREVALHRSCSGLEKWIDVQLEAHDGGARLWVRRASGRAVLERDPGALFSALGRGLAVGGVGVWIDDGITDQLEWSPLGRTFYGIAQDAELTHSGFFSQIHSADQSRVAAEIQKCMVDHSPFDSTFRALNGEEYRTLRVFGVVSHDGRGNMLLGTGGMLDVTEQLALNQRILDLENQLRAAQRGDVVGRLAAGIAHDFNNILTGILGCCEMLGSARLSTEEGNDLEQIRTATLRAAELTRQLLAFGRRQALRRSLVSPESILRGAVPLLRRTLPENIGLVQAHAIASGNVSVDVTQMHQVLTNLVVNAAQAMPDGGEIEIAISRVARPAATEGKGATADFICFSVEDTGPGVPESLRARIFEPFFTTKPPSQGSGLGLSVVQGIVEQHQGHIQVRPGEAGGACFEVFLPALDDGVNAPSDLPPALDAHPQSILTVLLVEDEKMVRELTKRILLGAGIRVLEAANGDEALEHMSEEVDILLTDVVLPSMSGPELVERCRERKRQLRVVYMSGYPADFVESRVCLGATDVLVQKPFTARTLLRSVRPEMNERES